MGVNYTGLTGIQYSNVFERIQVTTDTQYDILTYGLDNLYPQRVEQIKLASPLTKSSVEILEDFLNGSGWELNGDKVVNRYGETVTDVLNKCAEDAANFSGAFALHLNFNGKGDGVELQHIPFEYCRMHIPKAADGRIDRIAVSDNWENSHIKKQLKPKSYPTFNPLTAGPDTLKGGRGQVLYYTGLKEEATYPLATFDSILETCATDDNIQRYEANNVAYGFHGSTIVHWAGNIENKAEEAEIKKKVDSVMGIEGAKGALVVSVDGELDKPLIETVQGLDTDALFQVTLTSVRDRILQVFQQPPALMGVSPEGGVFTQLAYFESYTVYNIITRNKRNAIARVFDKVSGVMGFEVGELRPNELGALPNFGQQPTA